MISYKSRLLQYQSFDLNLSEFLGILLFHPHLSTLAQKQHIREYFPFRFLSCPCHFSEICRNISRKYVSFQMLLINSEISIGKLGIVRRHNVSILVLRHFIFIVLAYLRMSKIVSAPPSFDLKSKTFAFDCISCVIQSFPKVSIDLIHCLRKEHIGLHLLHFLSPFLYIVQRKI